MPQMDPRAYQIATLSALLLWGVTGLDLSIRPDLAVAMVVAALATQALFGKIFGLQKFDPLSPLISSLSLCLLLRTNAIGWAIAAAVLTIASKFLIRVDGRHLFNPTNFALVVMIATTGRVWVSPGQWGTGGLSRFRTRLPRWHRHKPRGAKRRYLRFHRFLRLARLRSRGLARRSDGHPAPPDREWSFPSIRLLHDL